MIVGNPLVFAIESSITEPYESLSQRALGFFVIYVGGKSYGVRSPDATLLGCSFGAVEERIAKRGTHCIVFGSEPSATEIADAVCAATYDEGRDGESFFGMSTDELSAALISKNIMWAPDGDEAFDDGGHVLQFDQGDKVRLIAFNHTENRGDLFGTLAETWISADEFYGILDEWRSGFEAERAAALERGPQ